MLNNYSLCNNCVIITDRLPITIPRIDLPLWIFLYQNLRTVIALGDTNTNHVVVVVTAAPYTQDYKYNQYYFCCFTHTLHLNFGLYAGHSLTLGSDKVPGSLYFVTCQV